MQRRRLLQMLGGGAIAAWFPLRADADVLDHGHFVSLRCLSRERGQARFLDGRTGDGSVGLAPHTRQPFTGTKWKVRRVRDGVIALECQGTIPGSNRWLDGRIADGSVALAPTVQNPFTGTRWEVAPIEGGGGSIVALRCTAAGNEAGWLEGRIGAGAVRLAATATQPFDTISWEVRLFPVTIDPGTNLNPVDE